MLLDRKRPLLSTLMQLPHGGLWVEVISSTRERLLRHTEIGLSLCSARISVSVLALRYKGTGLQRPMACTIGKLLGVGNLVRLVRTLWRQYQG